MVYRELQRNGSLQQGYHHIEAQARCDSRKRSKPHCVRFTDPIKAYVRQGLLQDYSPEQVVGRARVEGVDCVSVPAIYRYILDEKNDCRVCGADKLFHRLRRIGNRHNRRSAKGRGMGVIPDRVMIDQRPKVVNERARLGDFEAHTMWIAGKACLATVVERKSGLTYICPMADRKSETMNRALQEMLNRYRGVVRSVTVDNGKEFYRHQHLADMLGAEIYFAHPYRSGERGTNENTNGLLRQYVPRKTEFCSLSEQLIARIENKLNNRPRKRLGFLTPIEFFNANFDHKSVALAT